VLPMALRGAVWAQSAADQIQRPDRSIPYLHPNTNDRIDAITVFINDNRILNYT
jgi:hypothetical protein